MTEAEKKALDVLKGVPLPTITYYAQGGHHEYGADYYRRLCSALSAANLLQTGVEQQCVEACVAYARFSEAYTHLHPRELATRSAGRAAIEAQKPKPRWEVVDRGYGNNRARRWAVRDGRVSEYEACFNAEHEARAYCARKNAEDK